MRKAWIAVAALACVVAGAGTARAELLAYRAELIITLPGASQFADSLSLEGTGVATVNGSGGLGTLTRLHLDGGISTTGTIVVPLTDFISLAGFEALAATQLAVSSSFPLTFEHGGGSTSVLTDPGGGEGVLPLRGTFLICLVTATCISTLDVPLNHAGTRGVGIGGGIITVDGFAAKGIRLSIQGNPWTVGTAVVTGIPTLNGLARSSSRKGFVHGPASATSSAAQPSGVVQLVTPVFVDTTLIGSERLPIFGTLQLRFVPEPGTLLLLGSGVAGMALLARRRL